VELEVIKRLLVNLNTNIVLALKKLYLYINKIN
jgi:hypothetical protein